MRSLLLGHSRNPDGTLMGHICRQRRQLFYQASLPGSQESQDRYDQYSSCSGWLEQPEKLWKDVGINTYLHISSFFHLLCLLLPEHSECSKESPFSRTALCADSYKLPAASTSAIGRHTRPALPRTSVVQFAFRFLGVVVSLNFLFKAQKPNRRAFLD